jgi:hypothetical protein
VHTCSNHEGSLQYFQLKWGPSLIILRKEDVLAMPAVSFAGSFRRLKPRAHNLQKFLRTLTVGFEQKAFVCADDSPVHHVSSMPPSDFALREIREYTTEHIVQTARVLVHLTPPRLMTRTFSFIVMLGEVLVRLNEGSMRRKSRG